MSWNACLKVFTLALRNYCSMVRLKRGSKMKKGGEDKIYKTR